MSVTIRIDTRGLDALIRDLRELRTTGVQRAQEALDAALERAAEKSYDLAHTHEGDLRASQSHSSSHEIDGWEGQISYGSRGAAWEMQRGGEHSSYIDSLAHLSARDFEEALDAMFRDL